MPQGCGHHGCDWLQAPLPIVSICLRLGWKMGGVKDKYLKRENEGNQYVGRCASCLNHLEKEFYVMPPYFDFAHIKNEIDHI